MNRALLIKSCRKFRDRRYACWQTWGEELNKYVPMFEVIGGGTRSNDVAGAVIVTTTGDEYEDNSLKLQEALRTLLQISDFTHLFIVDDDTYIHSKRWLAHKPQGDFEGRFFFPRTAQQKRMLQGKPWVHGGPGWWMTRRLCEAYVNYIHDRVSWDDLQATKIAYLHNDILMSDRPDLYGADSYEGKAERISRSNKLITCHHVSPEEMHVLHKTLRDVV